MTIETKPVTEWSSELPGPPVPPIRRYISDLIHGLADRVRGPEGASPDPGAVDPIAADDSDPATPQNRLELARRLLLGAIRRYEGAGEEWSAVYESFPPLDPPRQPSGPGEMQERSAWRSLLSQADESFNLAEMNLAERIQSLFTMLDSAGRCGPRDEPDYFIPRAVRHGGNVYVLAYSAYEYEPKTNIVAVYRESMVLDLEFVE